MSGWTTPAAIKERLQKEWGRGRILAAMAGGDPIFPYRVPLKGPDSGSMGIRFKEIRAWIDELIAGEKRSDAPGGYRLEWREFNHPQMGNNRIPVAAIVEAEIDGLAILGMRRQAARFSESCERIRESLPALSAWIRRRPMRVLDHAEDWPRLLALLEWAVHHPSPGIYLRQIDAPGVDTKFIERHRALLAELLDIVLPEDAIKVEFTGASGFERRYGFRPKPVMVRFRILDPALRITVFSDLAVPAEEFARLSLPVTRVFITENEINFLAFPEVPGGIAIFGAGYGFDALGQADWLRGREIHYWGDIDTHGFAIIDQLRARFPKVRSLLMDRETLMAHRELWGREERPADRELPRLSTVESVLYDDLRRDRIAPALRLEQERVGFKWLLAVLDGLARGSRRENSCR
jgi:hypothetical protein